MYFYRFPHAANFEYASSWEGEGKEATTAPWSLRDQAPARIGKIDHAAKIEDWGNEVWRLDIAAEDCGESDSLARLSPPNSALPSQQSALHFAEDGALTWTHRGRPLFEFPKLNTFGRCGAAWILQIMQPERARFYGMGEKNVGFEKSKLQTIFYNTDYGADFTDQQVASGITDPSYVSIPYMAIKLGETWCGILIDNPYPVFMKTGTVGVFMEREVPEAPPCFHLGSTAGRPVVYFLVGPTLAELTRKVYLLGGVTPRPPLWALGHHMSRSEYKEAKQLETLTKRFAEDKIPNDGLWLDIDGMDDFRVFTLHPKRFKNPLDDFQKWREAGHRVVMILDPGVKREPGFFVFDKGDQENIFARNSQGNHFVGIVWPGLTVFPDFPRTKARAWWARNVADYVRKFGIDAFWLDMNDPATGKVDPNEMLFDEGRKPHLAFHNQYGSLMAEASREGLLEARPETRPFLLCRSGYIGLNRSAAVWTGDNVSNDYNLRKTIEILLGMSISGLNFVGADIGGFFKDTNADLLARWYQAAFLHPFARNHSFYGSCEQEPWAFGARTMRIIRHFIRLRYKLLPYLYNLFIEQERAGAPVMRPLFYEFSSTKELPLEKVDDAFLIGPSILQTPFLEDKPRHREAPLPGVGEIWFDATNGKWITGGKKIRVVRQVAETPLFVRGGAIIPMQPGVRETPANDLSMIDFHVFAKIGHEGTWSSDYEFDDGKTFAYQKGERSAIRLTARVTGNRLTIQVEEGTMNLGPILASWVLYDDFEVVRLITKSGAQSLAPKRTRWQFTGAMLTCWKTGQIAIGA